MGEKAAADAGNIGGQAAAAVGAQGLSSCEGKGTAWISGYGTDGVQREDRGLEGY